MRQRIFQACVARSLSSWIDATLGQRKCRSSIKVCVDAFICLVCSAACSCALFFFYCGWALCALFAFEDRAGSEGGVGPGAGRADMRALLQHVLCRVMHMCLVQSFQSWQAETAAETANRSKLRKIVYRCRWRDRDGGHARACWISLERLRL